MYVQYDHLMCVHVCVKSIKREAWAIPKYYKPFMSRTFSNLAANAYYARPRGDTTPSPKNNIYNHNIIIIITHYVLITSFELTHLLQNLAPVLSGEVHKAQRRHTKDGGTRRDYVTFFQTIANNCKRLVLLK